MPEIDNTLILFPPNRVCPVSGGFSHAFLLMSYSRSILSSLFVFLLLVAGARAVDGVVISEFVAANVNGLTDEDGANSDWIEIFNADTTPVNLAGWHLTDDSGDLVKWTFPVVTLEPKGFMVIFASTKNRAVAGQVLHTNFKLSAGGGYLGLVRLNGSIASEFNPYPPQYDDHPYGIGQTAATTTFFAANGALKYRVPADNTLGTTWTARTFTDTAWVSGAGGVGYETTVAGWAFKTWFANVGLGNLATANGVIATPSQQTAFYQQTMPVVNYMDTSAEGHYPTNSNPPWLGGTDNNNYIVEATGVVTIPTSGNRTFGVNSDDGFELQYRPVGGSIYTTICSFDGGRGAADTLGTVNLAAGDYEFRVMIFEGGGGSGGELFSVAGTVAAWSSSFRLVGDTTNGGLAVRSLPVGASGSGYLSYVGTNVQTPMKGVSPSIFVRCPFTVSNPATVTSLSLPVRYDDGFIVWLNGTEVARRNAPAGVPTNTFAATADRVPYVARQFETIDLTPFLSQLVAGANVVAIQGLNDTTNGADFLLQPTVVMNTITAGATGYYTAGTPGNFNTTAVYNKVSPVTINVGRGFYTSAQSVSLACATAGATIRYTFDGSTPTMVNGASATYATPIAINKTTTLRYEAFKTGSDPSDVVTQTYIFLSDVVTQSLTPTGGVSTGSAPVITNPAGATQTTTAWPAGTLETTGSLYQYRLSTGQIVDYGMDPNVVNTAPYAATIVNDLKAIPSVSIVTDLPNLFDPATGIYANPGGDTDSFERAASVEVINPDGTVGVQANCGLRIRGGFSRSGDNPKHAFRLFFKDTYGPGKLKYPLCGTAFGATDTFDKVDLRCSQNYSWSFGGDAANCIHLRDVYNRDSQLAMGQVSSHAKFYHLYINGQYWGLYNTDERPEGNFGATYFGGNSDNFDTIKVAPDNGYTIFATDGTLGLPTVGDPADPQQLGTGWYRLWKRADLGLSATNTETQNNAVYQELLGNNPNGAPNAAYPVLLDPVNLIDYMIMIYWGGNLDAAISNFLGNESPNNWFGFRDRTGASGGFKFVLHDSEWTLDDVNRDRTGPWIAGNSASQGAATALSKSNPQYIFQQCIYAAEFKKLFMDRVYKHFANDGALTPTVALARFDARKAEIDRAVVGESARWGDAKTWNGTTTPAITRDVDWVNAIGNVRNNFIVARTPIVLAQFRARGWYPTIDPPIFSPRGGTVATGSTVALSLAPGNSGTIYFTIDGSDPRAAGGGIAASAQAYAAPIVINISKFIRARVFNGTTWSAIDEAAFYVTQDLSPLAITEINYNPLPNGATSGDEYEFLELKNVGANTLDLGGLTCTTGITYTFPAGTTLAPGAFWVLARNTAQMAVRYPGVTVHGIFTGKLDNGGETLTLTLPSGSAVLSVSYSDSAPWPAAADGNGFTAVPRSLSANLNSDQGEHWRASANAGGSPGADDPAVNIAAIVVNEALSNSATPFVDTVELFNPTAAPVVVTDWWLTDDPNIPKKYRIPATTIPAGGYVAFDETQFNPTPGLGTSFALGSDGDDVYLFAGDAAGNLTGYSYGFKFSGAELHVSFGRYVNSVGDESFPRQISRTFGAVNSGPLVGPVVINEIMYNPYPGYDEFVELKNISGSTVNLFDPANPANTWKISGLGWTFPQGASIPAGGLVLVVPIDPATFRTKYNVPAGVQIFGPYNTVVNPNALDNSGERLSLEMPDVPIVVNSVTTVPYDIIDSVRYNDKLPWPVLADGGGPSLQRLTGSAYADDPANWIASGTTPGTANSANVAPSISITLPADNTSVTVPANVTFQSTASDTDGTIVKVEYYDGTLKIGEATVAPYPFVWAATGGVHTITAKAIDNAVSVTTSSPITLFANAPVSQGLKGEYFTNIAVFGNPAGTRIDATVNFGPAGFPNAFGIGTENFSIRWSGQIRPTTTGTYTFYTNSDDGVRLYVNGQTLVNNWTYHGATEDVGTIALTAGQLYTIVMEFFQGGGGEIAQLSYSAPGVAKQIIPQARLYPDASPIIITQPATVSAEQGTSTNFTVFSSGSSLRYQWRKNGVNIAGATNQTLPIPYVLAGDGGTYSVIVSNSYGFALSTNATLTATFTDSDGDGMQNSWEIANGLNPNSGADAALDTDGDGKTNLQEFLAGTDPRNPASRLFLTISKPASGPGKALSFAAQPYKSYTIQYKNALSAATWTKLTDIEMSASSQSVQFTDTTVGANTMRIYRAITPKQ